MELLFIVVAATLIVFLLWAFITNELTHAQRGIAIDWAFKYEFDYKKTEHRRHIFESVSYEEHMRRLFFFQGWFGKWKTWYDIPLDYKGEGDGL